jgi:hypothetical protein
MNNTNIFNLKPGDIIISGIERYMVLTHDGNGKLEVTPYSESNVFMKTWEKVAEIYPNPIEAIVEWYYLTRKNMSLPIVDERKRNKESEYRAVRLAINKDGYTLQELITLLAFALKDRFWSTDGLISLAQLRKRGESGLKKIETIKAKYQSKIQAKENKRKYGRKVQ